ncbi:MAG: hypothetical protein R2741_15455 [Methanolobus sp.]
MIQVIGAENIKIHGFEIDRNYENNDEHPKGYNHYYMMMRFTGVTDVEIYDMYLHDTGYDLMHLIVIHQIFPFTIMSEEIRVTNLCGFTSVVM